MARNQEKAQAMLNRFLADKQGKPATKAKRPHLASACSDLNEADRWRQQVLREIGRKVMEIQNAALGEHRCVQTAAKRAAPALARAAASLTPGRPPEKPKTQTKNRIRDLNDEINKLIREKGHWERRIVELGGPDYAKAAPKVTAADDDDHGAALGTAATTVGGAATGYRYFGAAKQLPGVKELFEKPPARAAARRTRAQLAKGLTPDYYGFRDEDDGALLRLERAAEQPGKGAYALARQREWEAAHGEAAAAAKRQRGEGAAGAGGAAAAAAGREDDDGHEEGGARAFVALPDRAQIEAAVVAKKKRELLARYASDAALRQQAETQAMLNPK
jgi:pre-mRNA-splicing factor ISY1